MNNPSFHIHTVRRLGGRGGNAWLKQLPNAKYIRAEGREISGWLKSWPKVRWERWSEGEEKSQRWLNALPKVRWVRVIGREGSGLLNLKPKLSYITVSYKQITSNLLHTVCSLGGRQCIGWSKCQPKAKWRREDGRNSTGELKELSKTKWVRVVGSKGGRNSGGSVEGLLYLTAVNLQGW